MQLLEPRSRNFLGVASLSMHAYLLQGGERRAAAPTAVLLKDYARAYVINNLQSHEYNDRVIDILCKILVSGFGAESRLKATYISVPTLGIFADIWPT